MPATIIIVIIIIMEETRELFDNLRMCWLPRLLLVIVLGRGF